MAETSWEALGPNPRAGGVTINRTGPGWAAVMGKSEAADNTLRGPLPPPVEIVRTPPTPAPQPSEEELRERLAEELAAKAEAQGVLDKATAAHQLAQAHLQNSKQTLISFEGLEAARDAHVVAALRSGGCPDLPDALSAQLLAREKARMVFAGADAALQVIADDVAHARDRLNVRTKAVAIATGRLFGIPADGFMRDIRHFEAEIERRLSKLMGYDAFCASLGRDTDVLRPAWLDIYGERMRGRSGSREELSVWTDAATKLHSDPQAAIEIADPPAPTPRPNVSIVTAHVAAVRAQQAAVLAEREAAAREAEAQSETPPTPEAAD